MTAEGGPGPDARDEVALERDAIVPDWLANVASLCWRVLVVVALVVVVGAMLHQLWVVSATVVVSVMVTAVMAPAMIRLHHGGRSRNAAALMVWAAGLLLGAGLLALLLVAFAPHLTALVEELRIATADVGARIEGLNLPPVVSTLWHEAADVVARIAESAIGSVVSSAASVVTVIILSVFLVFFLLRDGDRGWSWAFQSLGDAQRERVTTTGRDALERIGGYLRGTTILALLVAATTLLFLWLLGIPLAGPLTLLVFVAGYVPVVGGIVSTIAVLLVAFTATDLATTLLLLVLMGVRTALIGSFVRPSVYGHTMHLHPALVLLVLPVGYEVAGIIGLLAAVPVSAVVLTIASAVVEVLQPDPPPLLPGIVPGWLDRFAQWGWRILVILGVVGVAVLVAITLPLVVIPLVVGLVLTATLQPFVSWLERRGWSGMRAVAVAVGGGTVLVAGVLLAATLSLVSQVDDIGQGVAEGARSIDESAGGTLGIGVAATLDGASSMVDHLQRLAQGAQAVGTLAVVTVLGLLLTATFLVHGRRLWGRLVLHAPEGHRQAVDVAGGKALGVLGGYMIGTAAISGVGALSQWVVMLILGIPLALPVAVLSFILCFIPYVGGFLSTGIAFLLTVAYGSPLDVLIMAAWTVVFNIVQGNIVSPLVYGRTVSLHPAVVLLAIPAAGAVAGIVGMFIVVPAIGVIAATWRPVLALLGVGARRRADADARAGAAAAATAVATVGAAAMPSGGG